MIPRFGHPVAQLCMIFNQVVDIADQQWGRLLNDFSQPFLRPDFLESCTEAIYRKGCPLNNIWGFTDGTTRSCPNPRRDQSLVSNGHCLKYHCPMPNIIVSNTKV